MRREYESVQTPNIQVFLSYAREDVKTAERLYEDMTNAGVTVWLDTQNLLPGQRWRNAIADAIRASTYFLALLSNNSVGKRGFVQKELRQAIDLLMETPESDVFIVPVRLEPCQPSHAELGELHWLDLFPDYERGLGKLLQIVCERPRPGHPSIDASSTATRRKLPHAYPDPLDLLTVSETLNSKTFQIQFRSEQMGIDKITDAIRILCPDVIQRQIMNPTATRGHIMCGNFHHKFEFKGNADLFVGKLTDALNFVKQRKGAPDFASLDFDDQRTTYNKVTLYFHRKSAEVHLTSSERQWVLDAYKAIVTVLTPDASLRGDTQPISAESSPPNT